MRKAEDLIQNFLDSVGQSEGAKYTTLFRSWSDIVGEHIAAHSAPVDVRGTSLVIETDHPGWTQMIMMKRSTILAQVKRRVPEITLTGISVRVRSPATEPNREPGETPPVDFPPPPPPPPPSADEKQALERIEDEDMRDTLRKLREDLGRKGDNESPGGPL